MKQEVQRYSSDDAALSSNASTASSTSHSSAFGDGSPRESSSIGKRIKRGDDESDTDSVRTERSATSSTGKKGLKRKFRKATHTVRKVSKRPALCDG